MYTTKELLRIENVGEKCDYCGKTLDYLGGMVKFIIPDVNGSMVQTGEIINHSCNNKECFLGVMKKWKN